jgi:hypothetical protein
MRVNVYRNIKQKPSLLSIRCAVSGLVLGHAYHAELTSCRYVVQTSGQQRTRDTKQRNVHAWIEGNLEYVTDYAPLKGRELDANVLHITSEEVQIVRDVTEDSSSVFKRVTYNPYDNDTFILKGTDIPILTSEAASIYCDGAVFSREPKA